MKTNTKLGLIAGLTLAICATAIAQPATLNTLKGTYNSAASIIVAEGNQAKVEALVWYGKTMEALSLSLRQKGDLESFTVVDAELKRFQVEKTVPANTIFAPSVAAVVTTYNKQVSAIGIDSDKRKAYLLKQYTVALGILTKEMMIQNKIEEAKATSETKSSAEFELAELEAAMPVVVAKTNAVAKVAVAVVQEKSIVGKWNRSFSNGDNDQVEFYKDGRFEVKGQKEWSGTYKFANLVKTKIRITCNNGRVLMHTYDKVVDAVSQDDIGGGVYRRVSLTTPSCSL